MKPELRLTGDGSHTLFLADLNENYHSVHGAFTESMHVFIQHGLYALPGWPVQGKHILEIGLGTGLNALFTWNEARKNGIHLSYTSIEAFPLPEEITGALNYSAFPGLEDTTGIFRELHELPWNEEVNWKEYIILHKMHRSVQQAEWPAGTFDLVYFDAFAPEKQPDMWSEDIFSRLYEAMIPGGILVTYCAKGVVKRTLRTCGFTVEALPGPPGKREMTRARKPL